MSLAIGISTFVKRFDLFRQLVTDIRRHTDVPIMVMVNGELDGSLDPAYRRDMLTFCAEHEGVYPHLFPEFNGLAKLWNRMVIEAPTTHVWILNDDVKFDPPANPVPAIEAHIAAGHDLFYAPWGWSHFVIGRELLDRMGYFDERLLGVGEEDGDMLWRYEVSTGTTVGECKVEGVGNLYDFKRATDGIDTAYGNKTRFNTLFLYGCKYKADPNGHKGIFSFTVHMDMPMERQYPFERFRQEHKQHIRDASGLKLRHDVDWSAFNGMKPWVSE